LEGALHGPYFYLFRRIAGRLVKTYIPRTEVAAVRAACVAARDRHAADQAARAHWRALTARVRAVEER